MPRKDPLELKNWQLQAEFQNVIDSVTKFGKVVSLSASISWNPQRGDQQSSFAIGFNSDIPLLNSTKIQVFHLALGSLSVKTSFGSNQFIRIPQPYKFKVKVNSEGHGKVTQELKVLLLPVVVALRPFVISLLHYFQRLVCFCIILHV
ncbi:protein SEH1-like isoform X2 [Apium graveolens]|uniref:protein SEH1-like isoform X2 n=1 Tax=Apium graveolens TaxID=4045 RepID=UPI003D7AFC58